MEPTTAQQIQANEARKQRMAAEAMSQPIGADRMLRPQTDRQFVRTPRVERCGNCGRITMAAWSRDIAAVVGSSCECK